MTYGVVMISASSLDSTSKVNSDLGQVLYPYDLTICEPDNSLVIQVMVDKIEIQKRLPDVQIRTIFSS